MKRDDELRRDVERELEWEPAVDERRIGASVIDGVVTLTGQVPTYSQRWKVKRTVKPQNVTTMIEETFKREAVLDARNIGIEVSGTEVTLRGTVPSWRERHEAEKAAGSAPGVTAVKNQIAVESPAYAA